MSSKFNAMSEKKQETLRRLLCGRRKHGLLLPVPWPSITSRPQPSASSLKVMVVPAPPTDGDHLRALLQRDTLWNSKLKATSFPGLNEELDFPPFL